MEFEGLKISQTKKIDDYRGYFSEIHRESKIENFKICQINQSFSKKNVLRGLHYQTKPHEQAKLIWVSSGSILDVVVDLREDKLTYGKHFSLNLSSENKKIFFIPKGFAHGYLTLSDSAIVNYCVDKYYNEKYEKGINYQDPFLNIDWGVNNKKLIISEKDKNFENYIWLKK